MSQPRAIIEILENAPVEMIEVYDERRTVIQVERPEAEVVNIVTAGPIGPRGPIGPQGPQGPFAPVFEQFFADAQMQWTINHDLGVVPVVTLYDLNHEEITGDVMTPDKYTVIVTFELPMAGTARLKA